MKNVLIVHTWGIGDWLFFSPVLKSIKIEYPDVNFDVIVGTANTKSIVSLYPEVNKIEVVDVRRNPLGILRAVIKARTSRYDALIFTAGINILKASLLALFAKAQSKVAVTELSRIHFSLTAVAGYDIKGHRVENNLKILDLLGIDRHVCEPYLPYKESSFAVENSVLIHPGCDDKFSFKRWPAERYKQLSEKLLRCGYKVSVVLGPSERQYGEYFDELKGYERFTVYQNVSFDDLLSIIFSHEIMLSNDSGLSHIAAAMNRKVVSIFGPSDPSVSRPYSEHTIIIRTNENLPCMPCYKMKGTYGCKEMKCIMNINVDQVFDAIHESAPVMTGF